MTLPTYVGAGAAASGSGALSPGMPTHQADDILLLVVANTYTINTAATLSAAEGFVEVTNLNSGLYAGAIRAHNTVFWKRAASGAEVAPTVADNGEFNAARIYCFRGCETSGNPWSVTSSTGDNSGDASVSVAGATTTDNDCLVVVALAAYTGNATVASWTNASLSNVTEQDDTAYNVGGDFVNIALVTGELATAGAYGATTATWSTGAYWVWAGITIALKPPSVVAPTLAEGTTLAALQSGSASLKHTVAIEGYPYLITDATTTQAVDAWYDEEVTAHYTQALGGLFVSLENGQQLDWRQPFPRGGHLTLHVVQTNAADTLGVDVAKRNLTAVGSQTELASTLDRDDTTVNVTSTTGFASSGEIYIGTECIGYTGTTATSFTGCTRGKYAPMCRGGTGGTGWGEYHRVGTATHEVLLNPLVTAHPRVWIGKWVAIYLHKYDASIPALNSKDNALRVFAGRIVSIADDPATGATVIEVKHALDCVAEATIGGRDQWRGKIRNAMHLTAGMRFKMNDTQTSTTGVPNKETAADLDVVSSGAAGANQLNEGIYTLDEIYDALNAWWGDEKQDGNLHGSYSIGYWQPTDKTLRSYIYWSHTGTAAFVDFKFELPQPVALFLGFTQNTGGGGSLSPSTIVTDFRGSNGPHSRVSEETLQRYTIFSGGTGRAQIDDIEGTFKDQWAYLPSQVKPPANLGEGWGVFLIDNRILAFGWLSNVYDEVWDLQLFPEQYGLEGAQGIDWHKIPLTQETPRDTDIRQIFVLEMTLGDALKRIFKSSGTTSYNDATYDTLAHGLGIGLPGDIVNSTFMSSIDGLPHADQPIALLIDRTTRLSDLIAGELILRRAFLRWNNQHGVLEFATWRSPTASNSVAALTESNKAAPAGNIDHHRSVTIENGGWATPIVKIQYNRSLKSGPDGSEGYRDSISLIDRAAVDDLGGDGPAITINARGTLGDFHATGASAGSLANGFIATMPFFSRPARQMSRSIDQRFFWLSIGDIVSFDDEYARDPDTGLRGVQTRYAIVTRDWHSYGGLRVNSDEPDPQGGGVDLFMLDINRVATYAPAALVDYSHTSGTVTAGYDSADNSLRFLHPIYGESGQTRDVAYFANGDKIRIIEIDPSDPAAPTTWDRTILTSDPAGLKITLTAALSSPAWDATKKYRVIFDDYSDATTTQRAEHVFQADDSDVLIQNLRSPFEYGIGGGSSTFTAWAAADWVELPPNASYGDGVGRDVGHEMALVRLLNNLNNYKTCISSPMLHTSILNPSGAVSFGTATYYLVQCRPIFLTHEILLQSATRELSVAPFFRSSTGASASLRVTLSKTPPSDSDWFDVDRGQVYDAVSFTTTSTTWQTPAASGLEMTIVKNSWTGVAWLYVEVNAACETYGLATVQEGPVLVI